MKLINIVTIQLQLSSCRETSSRFTVIKTEWKILAGLDEVRRYVWLGSIRLMQ